ncbi:MAG: hypothetical protein ACRC9M_09510 [Aeromonas sp.]
MAAAPSTTQAKAAPAKKAGAAAQPAKQDVISTFAGVSAQDGVSGYLKVTITKGDYVVTGSIGEGSAKTITSTWTTPFESDSVGKMAGVATVANVGQALSGGTTVSAFNSTMVWEGTSPPSITLTILLLASTNPKVEVHDAIMFLERFASPELNDVAPGGRIPTPVVVDIGRRIKYANVLVMDVSSELDAPRSKQGYMLRNTVQLTLSPNQMINSSEIAGSYL